jgi:anti-sigma regulatory factor (Ser/Thr protein kinase)
MEAAATDSRVVSLTIPAKPDYVVLARLALSAVCRLAPLELEAAADVKLAITEAASFLMGGDRRAASREDGEAQSTLTFMFHLGDEELVIEVSGRELATISEEERELSKAIIEATADESSYSDGTMRLTKRLGLLEAE